MMTIEYSQVLVNWLLVIFLPLHKLWQKIISYGSKMMRMITKQHGAAGFKRQRHAVLSVVQSI
jgi:hypothetical protein